MTTIVADVPTASASRYLQQLCKHWSHKFATDFTAGRGTIALPFGALTLVAHADRLEVTAMVEDDGRIEQAKGVIASHLDRFAFREAPLPFDWRVAPLPHEPG